MGQIIFFITLFVWVGFDIYLFFIHNRKYSKKLQEKRSKYIMLVFILTGMFGAVAIDGKSKLYFMEPFTITRYVGIILMIFTVVIRIMVVKQLGPAFNIDIGTLPDQNLQTTKLFRVIRHPAYAAEIVGFIGLAIAFNYVLSSLMAFILPTIGVLYRLLVEEKYLRTTFGNKYIEYSRRTWRLIPFVF
ncbi:MAG: methyltransferase family protein [Petrotogales bacterium]